MLLILLFACGRDDILVAAEKAAPASQTARPAAPDEGSPLPGAAGTTPSVTGATPSATGTAPGVAAEPVPGVPSSPQPGVPGLAAPTSAGQAAEPTPGVPVEPKPAPPGTPQPNAGPQVTLSGSVSFPDYKVGTVRITVFDGDHSTPSATPPRVLGMAEIPLPGSFTVSVPQGSGKVYLEAAIDEDADGRPGPQEPQGKAERYPVTANTEPVNGLSVVLKRREPPKDGAKKDDF